MRGDYLKSSVELTSAANAREASAIVGLPQSKNSTNNNNYAAHVLCRYVLYYMELPNQALPVFVDICVYAGRIDNMKIESRWMDLQ